MHPRPAKSLLFTIMPLEILEVYFDCAGSQSLLGRAGCLSRCALVVAQRTFFDMMVTFRGRRKGTSCFGELCLQN